jgi:hypothetical protein
VERTYRVETCTEEGTWVPVEGTTGFPLERAVEAAETVPKLPFGWSDDTYRVTCEQTGEVVHTVTWKP